MGTIVGTILYKLIRERKRELLQQCKKYYNY